MRRAAIATLLLIVMLTPLFACMGEEPEEQSIKALLKLGRQKLEANDGSKAYNYFLEVLQRDPDNEAALYGITLALDLRVFAFIDGIIDLISGVVIWNATKEECIEACEVIKKCDLYRETWTTPDSCMSECPFGLQDFMFKTLIDPDSSCQHIRDYALDWITPVTPERCVELCEDFDRCGLIHPPVTFDVPQCIEHCPWSYVHHHEKYYKTGVCDGYDRRAFEHITVGLQVLFREIGVFIPPQTITYSDRLLAMDTDYNYKLRAYAWKMVQPEVDWDLSGRFTYGELYLSRALAHAFQTLLLCATSVNLEMNFPSFDINMNYSNPEGVQEILTSLIRVVEILLYDPVFPLGFQIFDEDWAYDQIKQSALEFGGAWEALADMFDYMFQDTDRQGSRALGYNDDNNNFHWDADETMTLKINMDKIDVTRQQAEAVRDLARAMQANFYDRVPFDVQMLADVLDSFNLGNLGFLIDLLSAWFPDGTIDGSTLLYEPTENGFRDFLEMLLEKMRDINDILIEEGVE